MIETVCKHCGKPQERKKQWKEGATCRQCSHKLFQLAHIYKRAPADAGIPRFDEPAIKIRNCRDCGVQIERRNCWRNPSCKPCSQKRGRQAAQARLRQRNLEARRYRILLAVSPYGSYEELLEALRVRNPKTWAFRYDTTMEKRARA